MALQSTTQIPTTQGSRYLVRLCKHWAHNLKVDFTPSTGTVTFPRDARGADWPSDATLILRAHEDNLECTLNTGAAEQLETLKSALARHLDQFAFLEAPLHFDWRDQ